MLQNNKNVLHKATMIVDIQFKIKLLLFLIVLYEHYVIDHDFIENNTTYKTKDTLNQIT